MEILQSIGNIFQVLAYIVGPVVLGLLIIYGITRSRTRKSPAAQRNQDDAVRKVYSDAEAERRDKERAAQKKL
jgi:hypothetical protein